MVNLHSKEQALTSDSYACSYTRPSELLNKGMGQRGAESLG